jgi:hypothetical protein
LEDAVKNSKFAYQSLKKDYLICNNKNPDDLDLISITQVYQLITSLKLKKRTR